MSLELCRAGRRGSSIRAMAFAGSTETSIQMNLERCGSFELILWQLGNPLKEVVRDPHGTHGVGTRRPRAHLVELLEHRHDRALRLLNHGQVG